MDVGLGLGVCSTIDIGLGLGVLLGLCILLVAHCRVGDLVGDDNFNVVLVVVDFDLRIVPGACIVLLRIEVGVGLFGDLIDNGSGRSIMMVLGSASFPQYRKRCKQSNPKTTLNISPSPRYFRYFSFGAINL